MKIPRNLKHAEYVDLIKEINERSLKTSEKMAMLKRTVIRLEMKIDTTIKKLNDLELRYCDLMVASFK